MKTSRKQVISQLAEMEKKLKHHQSKEKENINYLANLGGKKKLTLISILLPSFMMGWAAASTKRGKPTVRRFFKFGVLATLTHFRKLLI